MRCYEGKKEKERKREQIRMHAERISVPWLFCPAASRKKKKIKKITTNLQKVTRKKISLKKRHANKNKHLILKHFKFFNNIKTLIDNLFDTHPL